MMQFTNEWFEQGREEGRKEGRKKSRELVVRQLRRRLGILPEKLTRQIDRLDDADIFALGIDLLDFTKPADALRWVSRRSKVRQA